MKKLFSKFNTFLSAILLLGIAFSIGTVVRAVTPNPGHPWAEVGDGVFAVTGPTALRTFTLPDANAIILTANGIAKGGLITGTGADTVGITPVGADGEVLAADSASAGGVKWVAVGGTGTVTSVSVVTANGVSGSVANATTTPAITVTLGNITPTTVNGVTFSGSGSLANSGTSSLTAFTGSGTSSGTNTGDQTSVTGNAGTVTFADAGGDTSTFVALGINATGNLSPATDAGLTYNATSNALTAGSFVGNLTGNADTVTTNANLTGAVTSTGNATLLGSFSTAQLNTALNDNDVATGGGTATGTNTGDQTSIVGITGTKAQFDTAVTDGNFLYVGDITAYTDEQAQDAIGAMIDGSLTYVDGTPLLQRSALSGAITAAAGSNTTALGSFTTAQLNTALSDNDVATGGGTATGTNTGDQTTSGTSNRITVTSGSTNPVIDIAATYVGQGSITTVGALNSGSITSGFGAIDVGADNISTTGTVSGNAFDRTAAGALTFGATNATSITLGSSSITALTVTTDGTGNAEVVLPDGSISGTEITDATVALGDLLTQGTATDEFCLTSETGGGALLAWQACAGSSGATTALDNLSAVAINTSLLPGADNSIALGDGTHTWSDLFLGNGSVIDWNNGDLTLTHSANTITLAGGSLVLPNAGLTIGASVPFSDTAGTLTLQNVDAIDGTTESTLEAALDIAGDVDGTGLTAVDLDELAVETELEGVLDLADLQGAVTDGQVPNNITIDLATLASTVTVVDSTDATSFVGIFDDATGSLAAKTDGALLYNASNGTLSATTFSGAFSGNATTATALAANGGNCSAGSGAGGVSATGVAEDCTDYEEDLVNSAGLLAALSDETGTGLAVFNDSPTFVDDFNLATAGVKFTGADGVLTLLGQGNGNDEDLSIDFDNAAANVVAVSSSTGVTGITFGAIGLNTDTLTLTGTGTLNGVDVVDATTESTIESAIDTLANLTSIQGQSVTFAGSATLSGTNTGDQTSIVGITGTKAQFDTAVTDGNFLYVGDVTQYTDELAQDAIGAMIDSSLTYVDGTPLLQRAALTGAITASAGSNTTALGSFSTAQLNTALNDNDVATGGGTATGTNTGDQTTSGISNRITVATGSTNPVIDIAVTYLGQGSITTVGALNAGSITSGFGAINIGADDITTTGTVFGNAFDRTAAGALTFGATNATSITLGSSSITALTVTTDGTGDAEVVLPTGSISGTEILNDTVALTTDTSGNYVSSATASGGLVMTGTEGASLGILLPSATDALSATTSSGSGLELVSAGLTLLQGCADNQILKWNEGLDTWGCSSDASGGGAGNSFETIATPAGTNPVADSSTDTLTLSATGANFIITGSSGGDSIDFDIDESVLAGAGLVDNGDALDVNTGNGIQIDTDAIALGALSANWDQTGAFDIVLNNSASELKILESGGTPTLFGIFDVTNLSATDKTYTFPDANGTVITTGNLADITGLADSQISDTLTASIFIGSGSTTNAVDLATAEVAGILTLAKGGTGANLSDPGANSLLGWDDTDNSNGFWALGSGLSYDHGTHTLSASGSTSISFGATGEIPYTNVTTDDFDYGGLTYDGAELNVTGDGVFSGDLSANNLSGTNTGDQTTSGTSNRITVTNGTTNPVIDIAATYVGQGSITTVGALDSGSITSGFGSIDIGADNFTTTGVVNTDTLTLTNTGTLNGLDAIDGTGESTLEAALDIAGDVDGTGLTAVDLDELAVETELEGVLDLADLQGAVTDGQVPNNITIDLATLASTVTVVDSTDATSFVGIFDDATGSLAAKTDGALLYNASNGTLSATTFSGAFSGNATTATALAANGGNCSAGSGAGGVSATGVAEDCTDYEEDLVNSAGLLAALSDETGTGLAVFNDSPTFVDDFNLATAGVKFTGADGVLTLLGQGNGNDEDLSIDFDNAAANVVAVSSSTGVTGITFGAIGISTNTVTLTGTGTLNGLDAIDATGEATLEAALELQDLQGAVTDAQVPNNITIDLATLASTVTVVDSTDATSFVAIFDDATGSLAAKTDGALLYNASNGTLSATTFSGAFSGNATTATALAANGGNCSAGSGAGGVSATGVAEDCTDYEEDLVNSAGLLAALSDETGTGLSVFNDSPTFADDFNLAAAGVRFTGADGVLTLLGLGNGNDENLTIDLDNAAADTVAIASSTGVTGITFGAIGLSTDTLTLTGTGTLNGLDAIDGTGESTLEAALDIAGDVDGTGLTAVDLDELAVETELEGVLDLADLQGAVTDGQVPNNITIDLATLASTVTVVDSTDATSFVGIFDDATGSLAAKTDGALLYNATTGALTATSFVGSLTGAATDLNCTDCINATEIEDIYLLNSGDTSTGTLTITPAADTSALVASGYSLTGANSQSLIDLSGTWNTSGTLSAIKLNITDTASNSASRLLNLQVGSADRFYVTKAGSAVGIAIAAFNSGTTNSDIISLVPQTAGTGATFAGSITTADLTGSNKTYTFPNANITVNAAADISGTTLASNVVTSSLTTVGALDSGSITSGFGSIDIGADNFTTTGVVNTDTLTLTNTGTLNGLDAIDGTGESTLEAALDIAGDVDGTGLTAVDLDELAVETELEGVLDLADLQGAVTDGQVPNNITIDLATLASTVTVVDSTDATSFVGIFDDATGSLAAKTDGALLYNASNGTLSATTFSGAFSGNATTATALAANGGNCSAGSGAGGVSATGVAEDCTDYEEDLVNSAGLLAALSDETGTGLAVFNDSPTFVDDFNLATAGVKFTGADGVLTLLGQGNGNDEDLSIDFDNAAANVVAVSSSTGVTGITFGAIGLNTDTLTLTGTGTLNGVDVVDATTESTIESAIDTLANLTSIQGQSVTFAGSATLSGTNTGDQTSIVGITGTKAQFDTAVTDGNFLYVGDVTQYTDELAQDAIGAMIDSSLTYVDGTPLLQRAALTGAITASAGSNTTALGSFSTAQLNTALNDNDVATLAGTETLSGKTLTAPKFVDLGFIADANGNELFILDTVASAINEITFANAAAGGNPRFTATGGDTDVGIDFMPKAAGKFNFLATTSGPAELRLFEDSDNGSNYVGLIAPASMGSNVTLTLPNATDTLVGKATTDTFTNKTFDTAGAGNSFSINGTAITAVTGTGAVVLANSPTFVDDFDLAAAGVRMLGADGVLTLTGLGNGNDENLTFDFDNAASNVVAVASGTSVGEIDFGTIDLNTDFISANGTTTASGANAIGSLLLDSTLTNGTGSGFQFGARMLNTVNGGTAGTEEGLFIRMTDSTSSVVNTVRGIEVQAYSGTNTAGTNTGILSFGKTFGIQGVTTSEAAGVAVPAGVYAELQNGAAPTIGNAIRAYSGSATSATMVSIFQENAAFTGTGMMMDLGNGTGSFASGNFISLKNDGSEVFHINSAGNVFATLAASGTEAVCHANDGAQTNDQLTDCSGSPVADYAEMYPVDENIEFGDIVAVGDDLVNTYDTFANGNINWNKVKGKITRLEKSSAPYQSKVIGIVSDNYNDFSSTGNNVKPEDNPMPVALNGRVPVKISSSSGAIQAGDYLTTSSDAGKATKATASGQVIGKALEPWNPGSGKSTVMVFIEQGYYNGLTSDSADLAFLNNALTFGGDVTFSAGAEFTLPPLFNSDTAGFALIKHGDKRAVVTFDSPYMTQPVVSTNMAFDDTDNISDTDAQALFDAGIQSLVVNKSQSGFTILINKNAPRDLRFSWSALAVKNAKTYESVYEGLVFTPPPAPEPTPPPEDNGGDDQTPPPEENPSPDDGSGPSAPPEETPGPDDGDTTPPDENVTPDEDPVPEVTPPQDEAPDETPPAEETPPPAPENP